MNILKRYCFRANMPPAKGVVGITFNRDHLSPFCFYNDPANSLAQMTGPVMGLALLIHNSGIAGKNTTLPCPIKKRKGVKRPEVGSC
jgi:hypothetical protein